MSFFKGDGLAGRGGQSRAGIGLQEGRIQDAESGVGKFHIQSLFP